jgi:virginiamycin A acetyltransferase
MMAMKNWIRQKLKNIIRDILSDSSNLISITNDLPKSTNIINSILNGNIKIGERGYIYKCEMYGEITIGNNTSINGPNTDIICMIHPIRIGNFCSIARNVSIQEYNHNIKNTTSYFIKCHIFGEGLTNDIASNGAIEIGNDVWIGTQCVILSGAKIGNGAVIAANSVVLKEIPPYAIAAGSPAKVIKYRFTDDIIKKLQEIEWWNWPVDKIKNNYELFQGEITMEKLLRLK